MRSTDERFVSRRSVLAACAGAAAPVPLMPAAGRAAMPGSPVTGELRALERGHTARLGVFAWNTATHRTVRYRSRELFPLCSVFKTVAVGTVLRDLDRDGTFLAHTIRYGAADVERSGYAPVTGLPGNVARGMTVEALCAAAVSYSDNAAANLLLRQLGGPAAVTRFCRSIGDGVTRLDRWEPELNSAEPGRTTDTTTPAAIGGTYARLVLGDALEPADRGLLKRWLLGNTTGGERLRAGLPTEWVVADKTGTGGYGTTNDVGIAWPPGGAPVVMAVLSTKPGTGAPADEALIARTAAALVTAL